MDVDSRQHPLEAHLLSLSPLKLQIYGASSLPTIIQVLKMGLPVFGEFPVVTSFIAVNRYLAGSSLREGGLIWAHSLSWGIVHYGRDNMRKPVLFLSVIGKQEVDRKPVPTPFFQQRFTSQRFSILLKQHQQVGSGVQTHKPVMGISHSSRHTNSVVVGDAQTEVKMAFLTLSPKPGLNQYVTYILSFIFRILLASTPECCILGVNSLELFLSILVYRLKNDNGISDNLPQRQCFFRDGTIGTQNQDKERKSVHVIIPYLMSTAHGCLRNAVLAGIP